MLSATSTFAHTRYVCQGFKDEGRFYYRMDVGRCIGVLIRRPLASAEAHLATLNRSY